MSLPLILIFSLAMIILFHEWGHFWIARLLGVSIERFSLGFGPALFSWRSKKHLTQFRFCPVLLGGYVQFSEKEFLNHHTFHHLGRLKKIFILLAGPLANIFLAILLLSIVAKMDSYEPKAIVGRIVPKGVFDQNAIHPQTRLLRLNDKAIKTWSDVWPVLKAKSKNVLVLESPGNMQSTIVVPAIKNPEQFFQVLGFEPFVYQIPAVIGGFTKNSAAQKQGLKEGDKILKINAYPIQDIQQLAWRVRTSSQQSVDVEFLRAGQILHKTIILDTQNSKTGPSYFLGVTSKPYEHYPQWFSLKKHTWLQAISQGIKITAQLMSLQFHSWGQVEQVFKQISGPVGMVKTAQYAWSLSPKAYLFFLAWLSIGVGILNLLPIPILDGGQILLLILTKFFKSLEKEHYKKFLFLVSFLVILGLMMLGILNDGFG